jgi:hypothetical protein
MPFIYREYIQTSCAVLNINEISSCQRAIDFWLDNIFTDWSERNQIQGNAEQIHLVLRNINA